MARAPDVRFRWPWTNARIADEPNEFTAPIRRAARDGTPLLAWMPPSPFNPFPQMLYQDLASHDLAELTISPLDMATVSTEADRLEVHVTFHQHWTGWVLGGETDRPMAEARLKRALDLFDTIGGHQLVWTVHNAMPHECQFPELEIELRRQLAERANVIHIMNPTTPDVVADRYTLPEDKIVTIGHPNYSCIYPPLSSRDAARARLGIQRDDTVVALLGQVRRYKNLDLLLDAVEQTTSVQAIVAGSTGVGGEAARQSARAASQARVQRIDRHLDDRELLEILAAANAVVLPYGSALNSGILALARSHGRPAILPDVPRMRAIADLDSAVFFERGDVTSLAAALAREHGEVAPSDHGIESPNRFARLINELAHNG